MVAIVPVAPRSRMARRRPSKAPARAATSRSVGSAAPGPSQQDGRPGGRRLQQVGHRLRPGPVASDRPAPAEGRVEGRQIGRLGRPVRVDGRGLGRRARRLEAQVAVVAGRAVDHRVPGAGQVADPLERRDRQVAVGRLGRLEDLEHAGRIVVELLQDGVHGGEVDRRERLIGRVGHGPAGATERGLLAALAVGLRAHPSGRGSGRACPSRPCRCIRSGRPGRTGSRSRT